MRNDKADPSKLTPEHDGPSGGMVYVRDVAPIEPLPAGTIRAAFPDIFKEMQENYKRIAAYIAADFAHAVLYGNSGMAERLFGVTPFDGMTERKMYPIEDLVKPPEGMTQTFVGAMHDAPAEVEKPSKYIDDMTEQDWKRGVAAMWDSYRIV